MIKNIFLKHITSLATILLMLFGVVTSVSAAGLGVIFESNPLFYELNTSPGSSISRFVTVSNDNSVSEDVYFDTINSYSSGLADVMVLDVTSGANSYYSNKFATLFADPEVSLGTLAPGASRTYTFTVTMASTSGNTYQSATMGFDLCVGFSGGDILCDGSTPTASARTGGGGGGSSSFRLFNEAVDVVDLIDSSATISWTTNRNATSYLVCGNILNGPFDLDPVAPYFGYEFDTTEIISTTRDHSMRVSVPEAGTYECRPASREETTDDFTVGNAVTFIIPSGLVEGISTTNFAPSDTSLLNTEGPGGQVLGEETVSASTTSNQDEDSEAVLGLSGTNTPEANTIDQPSDQNKKCTFIWLLLILLITLLWSLFADRLNTFNREFHIFFNRKMIFGAVYVAALLGIYWFGVLEFVWWLFALSWCVMVGSDYYVHKKEEFGWNPRNHNLFYLFAGIVFIITSIWLEFPCVWWPFAVIVSGSLFLLVVQLLRK